MSLVSFISTPDTRVHNEINVENNKQCIDIVYIRIGFSVIISGIITILVTFTIIYIDYYSNKTNNSILLNYNNSILLHYNNITYINNTKIFGFYKVSSSYSLYQFKGNGNIQFSKTVQCDVLIVGGGGGVGWGGGGLSGGSGTGGGGGGGVGEGKLIFHQNELYTITIGKGGNVGHNNFGENGEDTTIIGKDINEIAYGGGAGGYYTINSHSGGSSGGKYGFTGSIIDHISGYIFIFPGIFSNIALRGNGILTYYGNQGGNGIDNSEINSGSGGGGAGSIGGTANKYGCSGNGGEGHLWQINNQYYGGGGGGGSCSSCIKCGGLGGRGGGGNGTSNGKSASNTIPYSGGGGGGGTTIGSGYGTSGASGTVLIGKCLLT